MGTVHEIAGVLRLAVDGAEARDLTAVARDVGPLDASAGRMASTDPTPPDIRLRFVDRLPTGSLRLLDGGAVGYEGNAVHLMERGGRGSMARVFRGEVWGTATIECRHGRGRVPLLGPASDLCALRRGWVPMHASAWTTPDGVGVLASGWAHSGKTGALLAACARGASPVGDDRVLLARDGRTMVGLGRPVGVKDWHLAQVRLPGSGAGRARRLAARAAPALDALSERLEGGGSGMGRLAVRGIRRARRTLELDVPVERLGAPEPRPRAEPHVLVLFETHEAPEVRAEPADPARVAARLAAHTGAELLPALRLQLALEYARPGGGWAQVERAPEMARTLLEEAVEGIPAWIVRHPYPCRLSELDALLSELTARVRRA